MMSGLKEMWKLLNSAFITVHKIVNNQWRSHDL